MSTLQLRLTLLLGVFCGIVYFIVTGVMQYMQVGSVTGYVVMAVAIVFFQFLIGPKIVEWTMRVRYIKQEEAPEQRKTQMSLAAQWMVSPAVIRFQGNLNAVFF